MALGGVVVGGGAGCGGRGGCHLVGPGVLLQQSRPDAPAECGVRLLARSPLRPPSAPVLLDPGDWITARRPAGLWVQDPDH